jgi:hypothetical protein
VRVIDMSFLVADFYRPTGTNELAQLVTHASLFINLSVQVHFLHTRILTLSDSTFGASCRKSMS